MKPVRIVLILGGGVSLGTYVAGALTELLHALRSIHAADGGGPRDPARVRIEVIAGASAGAMTGALVARALAGADEAVESLREAWVEEISIRRLARRSPDGFHPLALLSNDAILEIADEHLRAPAPGAVPAPWCGHPLRIGFTLTNLGGVRYGVEYANRPGTFFSTRIHRDRAVFRVETGSGPDRGAAPLPDRRREDLWGEIRRAAVASGTFPGAFPPLPLERPLTGFGDAMWEEAVPDPLRMWYVDGGVIDNEPVGLAKSLVEEREGHAGETWRYLMVDPYLDRTDARVYPGPESLAGALTKLAGALRNEAAALDWMRANRKNWQLEAMEGFLRDHLRPLVDAVRAGSTDGGRAMAVALTDTAAEVAAFKVGVNRPDPPESRDVARYLDLNYARIAADPRFTDLLEGLEGKAHTGMTAAIFVVESLAGLRDKEPMDVHLIAPSGEEEHPLAGDFLHNFGGFFHRAWREHDFLAGRRDARAVLISDLMDDEGRPLFRYDREPGVDYDPAPLAPDADAVPSEEREAFRDYLKERMEPLVRPLLPGWIRWLDGWVAGRAADRALGAIGFR